MLEIWRAGGSQMPTTPTGARAIEAEGWDGQMFMDSQSLSIDPYVLMGLWAASTERLKLSTGVTNPLTRHLAVTSASAASVHAVSGGRAVLGIGRGDSALAYLGHAPVGLAAFERALHDLQKLLSGEPIRFGGTDHSLDSLSLGARPDATALQWLAKDLPKVPLDVAATGPKVIEMAAPIAERVTFSVGAMADRIDWALGLARDARAKQGLTEDISYGAQVIVVCHSDPAIALEVAMGYAAPLVRFQVIQGAVQGPLNADDARDFAAVRKSYDMTRHAAINEGKKLIGESLTPDFVGRFTIAGPPDHCIERLLQLQRRGLDRVVIVGPGFYPESWGDTRNLFVREVMPAVRAEMSRST